MIIIIAFINVLLPSLDRPVMERKKRGGGRKTKKGQKKHPTR